MSDKQNPNLTLNLTLQEINVIVSIIQEIPYKVASPLLSKIVPQVQQAAQSAPAESIDDSVTVQ